MRINFVANKNKFWVLITATLLTISIIIAWFIFVPQFQKRKVTFETYYNALVDAEQVKSDKISTGLTAIVKDNPMIQWQGDRLKVATFTNHKYEIGSTEPQSRELWVTVVPELQNSCTKYSQAGIELIPRVEQLLGLPLSNKKSRNVVEFWVDAKDLFRPTPDPEITDHEAQLDFPQAYTFLTVSDQYKDWYNSRVAEFDRRLKEKNPNKMPAPWTRLGYTYDWGESSNHMGLSEFVLVKGGGLEVASVTEVNDYCRGDDLIAAK
ncbi:MAG: hypothetical protein AAF298_13745 [Cyanobacteria bacterium P01_A01_bin.40]